MGDSNGKLLCTLDRDFFEKLVVAMQVVPAPARDAVLAGERLRVAMEYDPQRKYVTFSQMGELR